MMWRLFLLQVFVAAGVFIQPCKSLSAENISKIIVEPESESESIRESLPFKEGAPFEPGLVEISKRLLAATDRFDRVDVEWRSEDLSLRINVSPKLVFEQVKWIGNSVRNESQIQRSCILGSEPRLISQERLSQISRCLVQELQSLGFLDANVILNPEEDVLQIEVLLGPPYFVRKIDFDGVEPDRLPRLYRRIENHIGWEFQPLKISEDTEEIRSDLLSDGFYFAEVFQPNVQVSPADQSVTIQWRIRRGPKYDLRFLGDYTKTDPLDEILERQETFPRWFLEEIQDDIVSELRARGFLDVEVEIRRDAKRSSSHQKVKVITTKGRLYRLLEPDFVGVIDREAVSKMLAQFREIAKGEAFNRDLYRQVVDENFTDVLISAGYVDLQLKTVDFVIDRETATVRPVLYMNEGDRYLIGRALFEGLTPSIEAIPEFKDLRSILKEGRPYDQLRIEKQRDVLRRSLVSLGYLDADVKLEIEKAEGRAHIIVRVLAGPEYRVSKVLIRGAKRTRERVLRDELGIRVGDIFTEELKREATANILRLGIARSIDVRVLEKDTESAKVIVILDIVEAARFRFEIGPGYGTLDGLRGIFKGTYANIGGTGRRISVFSKASRKLESASTPTDVLDPKSTPFIERNITVEYFEPRILTLPLDGSLTFQNSKIATRQYALFKNKFGAAVDYRLNRSWNFSTQYALEFRDPFNVQIGANTPFADEAHKTLTSVTEIIHFQHVDDDFNPLRGFRTRLEGSIYHTRLGGDESFWQSQVKQDFFYPVWTFGKSKTLGAALSINGGLSDSLGNSPEVPVEKRFYVGGENSVRGFKDQAISPTGEVGGKSFFYFQSEIFIPFLFGIDLLGFFDGGNAYTSNKDWAPWDLRYGAGAGLRWQTPVGPLKIGYGFNLDRKTIDNVKEPIGAFYFGVGAL